MSEKTANPLAYDIAREACEDHFSSRRIIGEYRGKGAVTGFYVADNNPFHDKGKRPAIYDRVIAAMAERGCKVLERASYPATGADAGYTLAIVFVSADPERVGGDMIAAGDAIRSALADIAGTGLSAEQHSEARAAELLSTIAERFPSLRGMPGVRPFDPIAFWAEIERRDKAAMARANTPAAQLPANDAARLPTPRHTARVVLGFCYAIDSRILLDGPGQDARTGGVFDMGRGMSFANVLHMGDEDRDALAAILTDENLIRAMKKAYGSILA